MHRLLALIDDAGLSYEIDGDVLRVWDNAVNEELSLRDMLARAEDCADGLDLFVAIVESRKATP